MDACTHEVRLNQWKLIIEQCQSRPDRQTTRQWLAENGIQEKTYYYWLRRVRKEGYSQLSNGSTSLPAMQEKGTVIFALSLALILALIFANLVSGDKITNKIKSSYQVT